MKWLPIAAKGYQRENGGGDYLFEVFRDEHLLTNTVRNILFENGIGFIKKWLVNEY